MRRMNEAKRFVSIKIDIEKTYNGIFWGVIRRCLEELDITRCLTISWIAQLQLQFNPPGIEQL